MNPSRDQAIKIATELAQKAKPICRPNPAVGATIIKHDRIIGQGHTQVVGAEHAEVVAIQSVENPSDLVGSELVVTLTPCCFYGRTPPCTDLIIKSKIKKVTILLKDPHPKVIDSETILRNQGIEVNYLVYHDKKNRTDLTNLAWKMFLLNLDYYKNLIFQRPTLTLKYAMSLDGKMADDQGRSKWISGIEARKNVHLERACHDAVLIGGRTFFQDNPQLDTRLIESKKKPLPLVIITRAPLSLEHHLLRNDQPVLFLIDRNQTVIKDKIQAIKHKTVYSFPDSRGNTWYEKPFLIRLCQKFNLQSIYVEGGAQTQAELIHCGLVDRISAYLAPVFFLGNQGRTPFTFNESQRSRETTGYFPPRPLWKPRTKLLDQDLWVSGIYQKEEIEFLWQKVLA